MSDISKVSWIQTHGQDDDHNVTFPSTVRLSTYSNDLQVLTFEEETIKICIVDAECSCALCTDTFSV